VNILFLAQRVPFPPNKGEKIRTFNQLKHLAEKKHKISVCAPIEQREDVDYFKELADKYCENISNHALTVKPLRLLKGLLKGQALSVANFYINELQSKFDCLLQEECFDVVICTSSAMAEYIYKSKVLSGLKRKPLLLMDFMDLDSDKWRQYADSSSWPMKWVYQREAKLLSRYEQQTTNYFDTSFFIADAEVELFKSQHNGVGKGSIGEVLTMGNGMDTELFVPVDKSPENESPVFIFTGVMDYKPNIDAVVWFVESIWGNVIKIYPKARFIIAGMNPSSAVKGLVNITGVEVTGFVDDILPYYHQADYFVAPFRIARGVQNKVLQAFACGLPVISTSMGAEGIDCVQDEHILIANNEVEFLSAVEKLERDKVFRSTIKQNALSLIHEHYSWQGKLQVLDEVLNDRL